MSEIPVSIIENKRAKRIKIKINATKGIIIVIPNIRYKKEGINFYLKNKEKAITLYNKIKQKTKNYPDNWDTKNEQEKADYIKQLYDDAKKYLPNRVSYLADKYNFKVNGIRLTHTKTTWGTCSQKGIISLNINIMRLKQEEQDYIILHELTHLIHFNHSPKFHEHLNMLCISQTSIPEKQLKKSIKEYAII